MKLQRTPGPARERLRVLIQGLGTMKGRVGWFESSKYPDGTPVAYIAAIHEFGYPGGNIPPRPTMRPTIEAQRHTWSTMFGQGAKAILAGNETPHTVMEKMGLLAAADIRKAIASLTSPPLKPETIKNRLRQRADGETVGGLDKPLVFSRILLTTLTHQVTSE